MASILTFNLTLYGQQVTGISVPIGSTCQFNLTCQDPSTRSPLNLSGLAVVMAVSALDARGFPTQPSVISRQATVTSAASGLCYVPWASGDTVPSGIPILPGKYWVEIWVEDGSGNRVADMTGGYMQMTAVSRLPGASVSPLPAQLPSIAGFAGGTQSVTGTASTTINPALGTFVKLNLASATNVTSLSVLAGVDAQTMVIAIVQPASGAAATVPTTWTNVGFVGGTFSNTATLNKRDYVTLAFDGTTSKWYELARSTNITS